ncbi:hypothetical protein AAIR98_001905 [Elusimicrobium simillimum]|uniref:ORF6N domain-containing protein n=1 Tax=Elusimicrobium simillimum TaxID=3143438 RepID=UPI003C6FCEB9
MTDIIKIENKVLFVRGQRVMLDSDLAALYQVETFNLNKAVKRNIERFAEDFMFRLTKDEWENLRFQTGISSSHGGRRKLPYVFTEHGVAMLSSVLNSKRAIAINIEIIRTFVALRQYALSKQFADRADSRLTALEKTLFLYMEKNDKRVDDVITAINALLQADEKESKKIGFKP